MAEIFINGTSVFSDGSNPNVSLGSAWGGNSEDDEDLAAVVLLADLGERFIPISYINDYAAGASVPEPHALTLLLIAGLSLLRRRRV